MENLLKQIDFEKAKEFYPELIIPKNLFKIFGYYVNNKLEGIALTSYHYRKKYNILILNEIITDYKNNFFKLICEWSEKENYEKIIIEKSYKELQVIEIIKPNKKIYVKYLNNKIDEHRKLLSLKTAINHNIGTYQKYNLRGYFYSNKNQKDIYYSSSYELRCIYLLEINNNCTSYERAEPFEINNKWRVPDLKVVINNEIYIYEIKPNVLLKYDKVIQQINDTKNYCINNNYHFIIWTEDQAELEQNILSWAIDYLKDANIKISWDNKKRESAIKRQNKYYHSKLKTDRIDIYCDFCKTTHNIMKLSYDLNINKNNRYICIKENGIIQGKKSKNQPYTIPDNLICQKCNETKSNNEFTKRSLQSEKAQKVCLACFRQKRNNLYKQKAINKLPKEPKVTIIPEELICPKCKINKKLAEFPVDKSKKLGYKTSSCIECDKIYKANWFKERTKK